MRIEPEIEISKTSLLQKNLSRLTILVPSWLPKRWAKSRWLKPAAIILGLLLVLLLAWPKSATEKLKDEIAQNMRGATACILARKASEMETMRGVFSHLVWRANQKAPRLVVFTSDKRATQLLTALDTLNIADELWLNKAVSDRLSDEAYSRLQERQRALFQTAATKYRLETFDFVRNQDVGGTCVRLGRHS